MMTTAPYGSWSSPITAADVARGNHPVESGCFVGDELWWSELRPSEGGRYAVRRPGADGEPVDVLPAPWNARTRVHEYGGGAWTVTADRTLVFAEFSDQRLYRFDPGSDAPVPITPQPEQQAGLRYGEMAVSGDGREVWCLRETHNVNGGVVRDICAVPVDGSAADDASQIRSIVAGSHFLAFPRVSPDGRRLAWIAWEHPQMPWDGTELRVADIDDDGSCGPWRTLLGSTTESVLQPEWVGDDRLYVVSDRSGWWNLYRIGLELGAQPEALCPREEDFGAPLWQLGARWYAALADGRLVTVRTRGLDRLGLLDPATGELADVELGDLSTLRLVDVAGDRVLLRSAGAASPDGLRVLDLPSGGVEVSRLSLDRLPDAAYLPDARPMTFQGPGGRDVHTVVYVPCNADFGAPQGELPPYIAFVHGGPTAHVSPTLNLTIAYFTSRGIGVVDVNYGGSSGYGRDYRERLRGQWGVVDVEDTVAAVHGLADAGFADRERLAIEGGSAGGWTVLAALTETDAFACGASYFGVAELIKFVADTHDFESHYVDGLIGPLPEARGLYERRAPVNNVDKLSCPVLLLQGLDDPIVPAPQAEMFRDAMVSKGVTHAYLAYEGESHGFRRTETLINAREAELSFYGQAMGFEPPDVPRLELWRAQPRA